MARRDLTGAVDFNYLETYAGGDLELVEEVLGIFRQQTEIWSPMLTPGADGWRDAVHTVKGAAMGIGANSLADACKLAEAEGVIALGAVQAEMDAALMDVAAYLHELALRSLKAPRG